MKISSQAPLDIDQVYETDAKFGSLDAEPDGVATVSPMRSLAHLVYRRRWLVIGIWIVPDRVRGLLCGPGVEAVVRVVLDPRLLGLRGQPADGEDVRLGRERAPCRRRHRQGEDRRNA